MRVILLLGLVISISCGGARIPAAAGEGAPLTLERLQAATFSIRTLRVSFTQEKHLAILDEPLRSSGTIELDRAVEIAGVRGALRWEFSGRSTLILARNRLRRFGVEGREESVPEGSPGQAALRGQMQGLLSGDWGRLQELFDVAADPGGAPILRCTARNADLGAFVASMELRFRPDLSAPESLEVISAGDDRTSYAFAPPEIGIDIPAARFAGP